MKELSFDLKLRSIPVNITDIEGVTKQFTLRELDAEQKDIYMERFKMDISFVDGKASIASGSEFKMPKVVDFMTMVLYDDTGKNVTAAALKKYPSTVITTDLKTVYNRGFTPGFYFKRMTEEDHQHKSPSNLSHYRYIKIGKVKSYFHDKKIARISINNGYLTKNDDIIIMGNSSDTYVHQRALEITFKGKNVNKTPRGTKKENILIDLKVNEPVIGKGVDNIYIFTDKTYSTKSYSL